jgi:hypothetical protein
LLAFFSGVQNLYIKSGNLASFPNDTQKNMLGIEQAFESMLDDILISFSGAQSMITPGGNYPTAVNITIGAVALGEGRYIYAVLTVNFLLVILFTAEAVHTRGWKKLQKFDYRDLRCLVVATVNGRSSATPDKRLLGPHEDAESGVVDLIIDPTDQVAIGKLDVKFGDDGNTIILISRASKSAASNDSNLMEVDASTSLSEDHHSKTDSG